MALPCPPSPPPPPLLTPLAPRARKKIFFSKNNVLLGLVGERIMLLKYGIESGGQTQGKHSQTGGILWAVWEMTNKNFSSLVHMQVES